MRGGSYSLYIAGAWGAPLGTKVECAQQTNGRVDQKFKLPFNVDQSAKDALKGFWYYSYYRECLHSAGYQFSGDPITSSSIIIQNQDAVYSNPSGGFSFTIPMGTALIKDNKLDVDIDDRMFVSLLKTSSEVIFIYTYTTYDDIETFDNLTSNFKQLPETMGSVTGTILNENISGVKSLYIKQDDNKQGIVFITPGKHVVYIYGSDILETTLKTVAETITYITD